MGSWTPKQIYTETGVMVKDLATLRDGMEAIFAKYAPCAIAVKAPARIQPNPQVD